MLKVGVTGGIGSGKTTICKIFESLNVPVYYADKSAKFIMTNNVVLKQKIISIFGSGAYHKNQTLNRKHIADIAFHTPEKLKMLNEAVHPAVLKDSQSWHKNHKNIPYTLKEAALLFESGSYKHLDKMITVVAPMEIRIKWLLKRDKTTREAILARIDKQLSDEEKMVRSDFIIYNDEKQGLIKQVLDIHTKLSLMSISL